MEGDANYIRLLQSGLIDFRYAVRRVTVFYIAGSQHHISLVIPPQLALMSREQRPRRTNNGTLAASGYQTKSRPLVRFHTIPMNREGNH